MHKDVEGSDAHIPYCEVPVGWTPEVWPREAVVDVNTKGLSHITHVPFGFDRGAQFYDEVGLTLGGGMHVFTCETVTDLQKFLTEVFEEAFSRQSQWVAECCITVRFAARAPMRQRLRMLQAKNTITKLVKLGRWGRLLGLTFVTFAYHR